MSGADGLGGTSLRSWAKRPGGLVGHTRLRPQGVVDSRCSVQHAGRAECAVRTRTATLGAVRSLTGTVYGVS